MTAVAYVFLRELNGRSTIRPAGATQNQSAAGAVRPTSNERTRWATAAWPFLGQLGVTFDAYGAEELGEGHVGARPSWRATRSERCTAGCTASCTTRR